MTADAARWFAALPAPLRALAGVPASALATAVVLLLPRELWLSSGAIVYLLAVLAVSVLAGRTAGVVASIVSFLAFDFTFIEPRFTLTISDPNEWIALLAYLVVAIVASQLAAAQRERYLVAESREREARLLHDLTDILAARTLADALAAVSERLRVELEADAVAISIDSGAAVRARADAGSDKGRAALREAPGTMTVLGAGNPASATRSGTPGRWVRVSPAYRPGRQALPRNVARIPIRRDGDVLGHVAVKWRHAPDSDAWQARLLDTAAGQLAVAVERERLRAQATEAEVLRRTSELKSALLDAVSHDMRTPLASIIGAAGSLLQADVEWRPTERHEFLETIEQEAERLDRIVGNLLDLSRIQGGTLLPARAWHEPALVLRESLGRLGPVTREHRLSVDVPDDLPPVLIDPVEIDQVVANLVENAAKYAPPGGEIRVTARIADGELRVSIDDNGPGVPSESLPRLFEPFYRSPEAHAVRGSGLGLAVAQGLIRAHGGRIWAQNRDGGGARFSFAIPAADMPLEPAS
jgi:two-component system, OmpR family, sensor histidine kinase KdpD